MDVYEAIEKRRTACIFSQGISEEQLRKTILEGKKALSGSNVQPWSFIIIDAHKIVEQIADYKYRQTLKMPLSNDPKVIEQIAQHNCQQTLEVTFSAQRAISQKNAYRNYTVIAVCNKKGHGNHEEGMDENRKHSQHMDVYPEYGIGCNR